MSWENEEIVPEEAMMNRAIAEAEVPIRRGSPTRSKTRPQTRRSRARNLAALRASSKNWGAQVGLPPNVENMIHRRYLQGEKGSKPNPAGVPSFFTDDMRAAHLEDRGLRVKGGPKSLAEILHNEGVRNKKDQVHEEMKRAAGQWKLKAVQRRVASRAAMRSRLEQNIRNASRKLRKGAIKRRLGFGSRNARSAPK
jgi:hypothetical protein